MKLVKSLLLGSAAGLCAAAGVAQAADLPMRKAAPVEYVRVCTAYGAGFFYIPGTDTCIRIGGRARFEYQYTSNNNRNSDVSGFRGLGRINFDARTATAYGTLRTFIRMDIWSRTGAYQTSGTQQRYANAFPGLGQDTFGRAQKYVELDKAFIQFAGLTAGRASSFFDFYAHSLEMIGASIGSDAAATNLLAYTATFGNGFSATLSMEDPIFRRNPTSAPFGFLASGVSAGTGNPLGAGNIFLGQTAVTTVGNGFAADGTPISGVSLDVAQRNVLPDFVGAVRYDQPWGSAQLSAAVHELRTGNYTGAAFGLFGNAAVPVSVSPAAVPDAEYGYAVQGGLKVNLPQLAPGDELWLQAAYAQGAGSYTGVYSPQGAELNGSTYLSGRFTGLNTFGGYDMAVDALGQTHLTESYSGTIGLLHYWTPELRQAVFATYGRVHFDSALRSTASPAIGIFTGPSAGNGAFSVGTGGGIYSGYGKDWSNLYVGSNLIYSPVRDLDLGVEVVYERLEFLGGASGGKVVDNSKTIAGLPTRTISYDDNILARFRVQRDF